MTDQPSGPGAVNQPDGRQSGGPDGHRRRRGGGEQTVVPEAEFRSYYGRPIVKAPVWRHDIPSYFFTGGVAAGAALLAAGADLTGRPVTRRWARLASVAALGASTYFLINDLGRPDRFHHMLRVAKPTSPMSMGTWILSGFGALAGSAAAAEVLDWGVTARGSASPPWLRVSGRVAGVAAAAVAPALATYTAVLISDTAVPSWHEAYPALPFAFAGSALASGAGVGLLAAPPEETGPARRLAAAGAVLEAAATHRIENRLGLLSEPYRRGRAGTLLRAGRVLTTVGAIGAALAPRSRVISALSGLALLAGSAATRFGIYEGGVASAKDPKYTVVPQRERLKRRAANAPPA